MNKDILKTQNEFEIVCSQWLYQHRFQFKQSTFALYSLNIEKYILPYFRDIPLSHIGKKEISAFTYYLLSEGKCRSKGGLAPSTVSNILTVLCEILKFASKDLDLITNIDDISFPHHLKANINTLSRPSWHKLQLYLMREKSPISFGILLSMYTGIRIGELCGLQWRDINSKGVLSITKTLIRIKNLDYIPGSLEHKTKVIIDLPKSPSSIRKIPIPDTIVTASERFSGDPDRYILTDTHKYMEPRALQYKFKQYLNMCNLPSYNFHCLRHSFATSCIESVMDYKSLSEILGNSSVKTTLGIYVHSNLTLKKRQMEAMAMMMQ